MIGAWRDAHHQQNWPGESNNQELPFKSISEDGTVQLSAPFCQQAVFSCVLIRIKAFFYCVKQPFI
jgi:hypothetical protein